MVPGRAGGRLLEPRDARLRRVADQRGRAGEVRRHVPVQVLAGVRPDRDDRRRRQPLAGGSRHERTEPASPALVRPAGPGRRAAHRRRRRRSDGVRGRRGRRDLDPLAAEHGRLLEPAGGDGQGVHRRRLVQVGRRRLPRRRRLPLHPRPGEGHDRVRRRERVPGRGRERADGPPGDRRRRGHRRAAREVGRDRQGDGRAGSGQPR